MGDDRRELVHAGCAGLRGDNHKGAADVGVAEEMIGEAPVVVGRAVDDKDRRRPVGLVRAPQGFVGGVRLLEVAGAGVAEPAQDIADPQALGAEVVRDRLVARLDDAVDDVRGFAAMFSSPFRSRIARLQISWRKECRYGRGVIGNGGIKSAAVYAAKVP